jgi:uncharacterized LabA/DUF88 family protein
MKKIGIFLDISNLYYSVKNKYNRKIDYKKYWEFVEDLGEIQQAIAYGASMDGQARNFIHALRKIGFLTKFKQPKMQKANWDVGIAVDAINMIGKLDLVVLGSADGDFAPLTEYLRLNGVDVIILACNISKELRNLCTRYIEIPESLLEVEEHETVP